MSVLELLDATRICAHWSPAGPDAWARPVPVPHRPVTRRPLPGPPGPGPAGYSWRALARNPQALLVTGMVGALVAADSAARLLPRR